MDHYDELSQLFDSEDGNLFRPKPKKYIATADDRLVESFDEITRFVQKHGRKPNSEADDLKEASLGTRLNSIRTDKKKLEVLTEFDELGLLELDKTPQSLEELFSDNSGLFAHTDGIFDLAALPDDKRSVQNTADAAQRTPSKDFAIKYQHDFAEQQAKLATGERKLTPFLSIDQLTPNTFYVYDGMMCYVVKFGKVERKAGGYSQQRLSVIFENGTESHMYRRSLAQRLYEGGSVVVDADYSEKNNADAVGRIYILRSLSDDPKITTIKDLYKIGITTGSVEARIRSAAVDPTYLMAPVHIVASYKLTGEYDPQKVEALIHRILADTKVDMTITDKNNREYTPSEWYSVPLPIIVEVVDLINTGEITHYHYDKDLHRIVSN